MYPYILSAYENLKSQWVMKMLKMKLFTIGTKKKGKKKTLNENTVSLAPVQIKIDQLYYPI